MTFEVTQHKAGHRDRLIHPDPVCLELQVDSARWSQAAVVYPYDRRKSQMRLFEFVASGNDDAGTDAFLKVLAHLRGAREPISLELLGNSEFFMWQLIAQAGDANLLQSGIASVFENSYIQACPSDCLYNRYQAIKAKGVRREYHLLDYAGKSPEYAPVFNENALGAVDLILHMQGVSEHLAADELAFYQVIFQPCRQNWARLYQQMAEWETLLTSDRGSAHGRTLKRLSESMGSFAVALRVGAFVAQEKATAVIRRLDAIVRNVSIGDHRLRRLTRADYFQHGLPRTDQLYLLLNRVSFREGMILTQQELAALLPCFTPQALDVSKTLRVVSRTYPAPRTPAKAGVSLGVNVHRGHSQEVFVGPHLPNEHVYIIGKSGYGKSTLMELMISQHLEAGEGFGVIDPHGDLIRRVLAVVPQNRVADTVYFNPADPSCRLPFNILAHNGSDVEKEHLRADLLDFFEELIGEKLGVRIEHVLNYIIVTLLTRRDSTLADAKRVLTDHGFKNELLRTLKDPDLIQFWQEEFPAWVKAGGVLTITNKLSPLLLPGSVLAPILSSRRNTVDFAEMMDHGRIFLCDLSQGALTKRNSKLLGRLILTRIAVTAMMRDARRRPCPWYLYVDEVQDLASRSLEEILRGSRKFGLHLRLANQARKDLPENLRLAVANAATTVFFCLDDISEQAEAEKLLGRKFTGAELGSLPRGHAVMKMDGHVFILTVPVAFATFWTNVAGISGQMEGREWAGTQMGQPGNGLPGAPILGPGTRRERGVPRPGMLPKHDPRRFGAT